MTTLIKNTILLLQTTKKLDPHFFIAVSKILHTKPLFSVDMSSHSAVCVGFFSDGEKQCYKEKNNSNSI